MRKTDLKWRTGVCLGREDCIRLCPFWGVGVNVGGQTSRGGQLCVRVHADGFGVRSWTGRRAADELGWRRGK